MVKNLLAIQETWVQSLCQEDPPEEGMVTHSNILAWGIPLTEEPNGLQSMGLKRIGHNWVTDTHISGKEPQFCWHLPFLNINFFFFLAAPHSMWDLSSQTRDRTHTRCIGSTILNTGQPEKSAFTVFAGRKVITWQGLGRPVSGAEVSENTPTGPEPCWELRYPWVV